MSSSYKFTVKVIEAKDIKGHHDRGSNAYCKVVVGKQKIKTKTIKNSSNPVWSELFEITTADLDEVLKISVEEKEALGRKDLLGSTVIPLKLIVENNKLEQWFDLDKKGEKRGSIKLLLKNSTKEPTKSKDSEETSQTKSKRDDGEGSKSKRDDGEGSRSKRDDGEGSTSRRSKFKKSQNELIPRKEPTKTKSKADLGKHHSSTSETASKGKTKKSDEDTSQTSHSKTPRQNLQVNGDKKLHKRESKSKNVGIEEERKSSRKPSFSGMADSASEEKSLQESTKTSKRRSKRESKVVKAEDVFDEALYDISFDTSKKPIGIIVVHVISARQLKGPGVHHGADPYCEIGFEGEIQPTNKIKDVCNPNWKNQSFVFYLRSKKSRLVCYVWDGRNGEPETLGRISIGLEELTRDDKDTIEKEYKLVGPTKEIHVPGKINLQISWYPAKDESAEDLFTKVLSDIKMKKKSNIDTNITISEPLANIVEVSDVVLESRPDTINEDDKEKEDQKRIEDEKKRSEELEKKVREEQLAKMQKLIEEETKAKEEQLKAEAERKKKEELERIEGGGIEEQVRLEAERKQKEELERKHKEELDKIEEARKEVERIQKEELERKHKEEQEKKHKEEQERKHKEEQDRIEAARKEAERKHKEEQDRIEIEKKKQKEEQVRKEKDEAERKIKEEQARRAAENKQKEEQTRKELEKKEVEALEKKKETEKKLQALLASRVDEATSSEDFKERESIISSETSEDIPNLKITALDESPIKEEKISKSKPLSNLFSPETAVNDENLQPDYLYKVIILGDSGVGKTQFYNRWINDKIEQDTKTTISIAISAKSYVVEDRKIAKIGIWDTAGQERYRAISRQYYRNAHGVVMMFDLTERSSFESVPRWLEDLQAIFGPDETSMILIGNKSDLADRREVMTAEALRLAEMNGISYLETSALLGDNCVKAMQTIMQEIHREFAHLAVSDKAEEAKDIGAPKTIVLDTNNEDNKKEESKCPC